MFEFSYVFINAEGNTAFSSHLSYNTARMAVGAYEGFSEPYNRVENVSNFASLDAVIRTLIARTYNKRETSVLSYGLRLMSIAVDQRTQEQLDDLATIAAHDVWEEEMLAVQTLEVTDNQIVVINGPSQSWFDLIAAC